MWFDNHCHLTSLTDDPVDMVADAARAGVTGLMTVGTTVADSARAAEVATAFPTGVWATAGVHPHDASGGIDGLVGLLDHPRIRAVGECGLDYHYDHSPRPTQAEVFRRQIALAHEHDLALVIHTREAWDDTFAALDAEGMPERTVFHCFTGGPDEVTECLARGAWISISGIVTFGSAADLRAAARLVPLDRLLVETDSPYLAPVPHRGRPNRPALVAVVGAALADLRAEPEALVAAATTDNARTLYRLVPPDSGPRAARNRPGEPTRPGTRPPPGVVPPPGPAPRPRSTTAWPRTTRPPPGPADRT
ncbi:MAG: TatD family hydrolase, partial [Acidimicrobiales bacterium]